MFMQHQPPLVIISGAIGSGKGTIVHALAHELDLAWIPTHTTRTVRNDDNALSKRMFDTETTFMRHVARNEFIEMVKIAEHHYGLLRSDLDQAFAHKKPAIVELNVDGAIKVSKLYPNSILIFIQAEEKHRRERIKHRNMSSTEIDDRMHQSAHEEKIAHHEYDFLIENKEDHPEITIDAVKEIIIKRFPEFNS